MRTWPQLMRVIFMKRLRDFYEKHADATGPLRVWYKIAADAKWSSLEDVRLTCSHADSVAPYNVFNIKGNTYRLLVKIEYAKKLIFIHTVLTHAEYDKDAWK